MNAGDTRSVLDLVDEQYRNAATRSVRRVVLDLPPANAISKCCARLFADVDRDDDKQRRIARQAWLLRTAILQTFLPFGDERLGLAQIAGEIRKAAEDVPAISAISDRLSELVSALLLGVPNPKREWFLEFLAERTGAADRVAVFTGLQAGATPGWPPALADADFADARPSLIRTRKEIRALTFSQVVIPGTLRFAPQSVVHDLIYGGRSAEVILLTYRQERTSVPVPLELPADPLFERRKTEVRPPEDGGETEPDRALDEWANESFWSEIRSSHSNSAPLSERDVTVPARFVLFGDGTGSFLPDDGTVLELSALLDEGDAPGILEQHLPRKAVRELEERDVVLLRISGSGHYLEDVADSLMSLAGCPNLRADATEWKSWLHAVIKRHGEGVVAREAREAGVKLRSSSYLWVWAGDAVIAPHDFATFNALIAALQNIDSSRLGPTAAEYAKEKWEKMDRLKAFHHRAGVEIREALLKRVRELVSARQKVETSVSIELPGLEAGRMGLLRVAAVDHETVKIPLSRLFHVQAVRQA